MTIDDIDQPTPADRMVHALMGHFTGFISPGSMSLAWVDWLVHLSASPGKQQLLMEKAARKTIRLLLYVSRTMSANEHKQCIEPLEQDRRFRAPQWQRWPFCLIYQSFLMQQQWWHNATTGIGGMSAHHQQVASFASRQLLDVISPVNFIGTNPEVLEATWREGGHNLWRGWQFLIEDWERSLGGHPPQGRSISVPVWKWRSHPGRWCFVTT